MNLHFKKLLQISILSLATIGLTYLLSTSQTSHAAPAKATQSEKKTILFLAGKPSHTNGLHEFRAGSILLAKALNESGLPIEAKVHYYGWPEDESIFDGVDACIVYADRGGAFEDKYAFLDKKVKEGMGIMFMHYGVHPKKEIGEQYFLPWIGGYMDDDLSVNPHWIADLLTKKDHPISRGIDKPITAYDEFYYNMKFDEDCDCCYPLVTAIPTEDKIVRYINMWNPHGEEGLGKPQSLMWTRDPEEGARGIGFVGGHYHHNWAIDGFRQLVLNSIVWVARGEVPSGGVPSQPITLAELNENLDEPTGTPIALPTAEILEQPAMKRPDTAIPLPAKRKSTRKKLVVQPNDRSYVIAESRGFKSSEPIRHQTISADIEGLEVISLIAKSVGSDRYDWINWADVYFTEANGKRTPVTPKHISWDSQRHGQLRVDRNVNRRPMVMSGQPFEKGFGGHAPSEIQLRVPKNAVKITATCGLDDSGALRLGKPTGSRVAFNIINSGGSWRPKGEPITVPIDSFNLSSEDLEVTLWAQSPQVFNPTNMDVDHKGRIWVTEGVNYRKEEGRRPEGDRIIVLEDTDKDGKADKTTVFVQSKDLAAPLGVSVFDNKIVVPNPPHLVVYTDVNRNLVFDEGIDTKENLLTGFNGGQHDHSLHSVTHGPDGRWYFNSGNCGAIFTDRSNKTFNMNGVYRGGGGQFFTDNHLLNGKKSDDGFLWTSGFGVRINPDGTEAEITGHGFRNSYEHSVNSMGDIFQNDNDDFSSCRNSYILEYGSAGFFTRSGQLTWRSVARPGEATPSAHWRQNDPGTFDVGDIYGLGSPTGNVVYENGALGQDWVGAYFSCEAARNTIFGYKPKEKGAGFELNRFDFATTNTTKEFVGNDGTKKLASLEEASSLSVLFRPSDICVGPDGALYVTDWLDGRVGGHSTIDPSCSGAIYRIAPKGFQPSVPDVDFSTTEGQIAALKSPAVNVRHGGFHGLKNQGEAVYDVVAALLDNPNKFIASRAIYLLPYLGDQGKSKCESLLESKSSDTRLVAYRALRRAKINILPYAAKLANDENTAVRRDVALSLRHYTAEETKDLFTTLAKGYDGSDKNYVESIGLAAENKETAIWKHLKQTLNQQDPEQWSAPFTRITWRLWTPAAIEDLKVRASSSNLSQEEREFAVESISFINDKRAAEAMLELGTLEEIKESTTYWLLRQGTAEWKEYDIAEELKTRGIYDPDAITVTGVTVAEPKKRNYEVTDVLKLTGDAEAGKGKIARCIMCHQIDGVGPQYGPQLQGWGPTQSREAIIRAIVDPSFDLAHGYKGRQITLKDGTVVQGLTFGAGDPTIIMSTGGITQMIPQKMIKKDHWFSRSLMLSADQLGLTAQDVADIVAHMQRWN